MEKKITYVAKGFVLGTTWLDTKGAYPTKLVDGNSIEEIESKINHMIETNVLDNGMGFKNLIGASMTIRITTKIVVDGDTFFNYKYRGGVYGSLTTEEEYFLDEEEKEYGALNFPSYNY